MRGPLAPQGSPKERFGLCRQEGPGFACSWGREGKPTSPGSVGSVQVLTSPGGTQASDLQLWHLQLSLPGRVRIRSCSFALGQNAESGQPRALQEAHSLLSPLSRLPPAESFSGTRPQPQASRARLGEEKLRLGPERGSQLQHIPAALHFCAGFYLLFFFSFHTFLPSVFAGGSRPY